MGILKSKYYQKLKMLLDYNESLSTCAYINVGAVLSTTNGKIIAEGYNGTPANVIECKEIDELLILLSKNNIKPAELFTEILNKFIEREDIKGYLDIAQNTKFNQLVTTAYLITKDKYEDLSRFFNKLYNRYKHKTKSSNINFYLLYKQFTLLSELKDIIPNDIQVRRELNYIHSRFENHAEKNLIQTLKITSINELENMDLVLFVSKTPCFECTKFLNEVFPSIRELYYKEEYIDRKYNESTIQYWKTILDSVIKIT